jgi:hypothetical protein
MPVDYQALDMAGSHFDLGYRQGLASERFAVPDWWPAPPPLEFAIQCAQQVEELHAPLLDELRGYAEAQRLPYEELLRGVCRRSMRLRARAGAGLPLDAAGDTDTDAGGPARAYPEGGCSSFAVVAADGRVLAGRNYDFHPVQRVRQRLRLKPDAGRPTLGMRGSVPGGRYDGVNDAGVFICLHVALADEPETIEPGIPFHLLPRVVLETCTTTAEAVDRLLRVRHLHAFNYLLADASGDLAVVEAHPQGVYVAERNGEFVAATNHYRQPEMAELQGGQRQSHSHRRLDRLYGQRERLRQTTQAAASGAMQAALSDHESGLCGHSGGHTTLWSMTADLTAKRVAYARGAPCETGFEEVGWPG